MTPEIRAVAPTIDVDREIAEAPIGAFHWRLAFLLGSAVFFEGYDTFNVSYVLHYVIGPWHLAPGRAGLIVSSGIAGFSIAALIQGKVSDAIGRRDAIIASLWIATLCSLGNAAWGRSFLSFCVWRALTGVGLGVLLPVSVAFLSEHAPVAHRARLAAWSWSLGFSLGGIAASAVGVYLTPTYGWPCLYVLASTSALVAIACHAWLPESIPVAALRGRTANVVAGLVQLVPSRAALYRDPAATFVLPERTDGAASFRELVTPRYRRTTVAASAAAFFALFAVYGLTSWSPTAMLARGETLGASFGFGAVILGMNFIGTLASGAATDRLGLGRLAPGLWWAVGGTAVGLLAIVNGHVVNAAAMAVAGFGILGGQGALNNLTAAWYETRIRATAVGTMLGVGRMGAIVGPYAIGLLQQVVRGPNVVFLAIGAGAWVAAMLILMVPTSIDR